MTSILYLGAIETSVEDTGWHLKEAMKGAFHLLHDALSKVWRLSKCNWVKHLPLVLLRYTVRGGQTGC